MIFDVESLQKQIPYYLTAEPERRALVSELKALNEGSTQGYFIQKKFDPYNSIMLQGDGWSGFQMFSFLKGERRRIRGIILSNSCDIALENQRTLAPKIVFASIVKLANIRIRFEKLKLDHDQIESKLLAIRSQSISNIFYLPAGGPFDEEHVALLDDLHSIPVAASPKLGEKIFTLAMPGFYLFAFKLSVHFCRLHENVDRKARAMAV